MQRTPFGPRLAPLVVGLVSALVAGCLLAPPGGASAASAEAPAPGADRIIGGETAPPGTWRSQAALLRSDIADRAAAQICGGTLIDPSWVLSAGHCVADEGGGTVAPGRLDVLVGTQDLRTGGQRVRVDRIVVRTQLDLSVLANDFALLRLSRPVGVPRDLVPALATDAPPSGAVLSVAGWGQTEGPSLAPPLLRQVQVPALSAAECEAALDEAQVELGGPPYHSSHLCTGPIGTGGKGPCYGDSGGPLVWDDGGRKVLVGVVSWGLYCGSPETPSVFARVASAASWVRTITRLGPHPDRASFEAHVVGAHMAREWSGLPPSVAVDDPGGYMAAVQRLPQVERRDAAIVRLYDAVLDRSADAYGYAYWRERLAYSPATTARVAEVMSRSAEFQSLYGALDDASFVEQIYLNVLERPGEASGLAYWTSRLGSGEPRGSVVDRIAQSVENVARTRASVDVQVAFLNLFGRAATPSELATWSPRPLAEVSGFLLHSWGYAQQASWGWDPPILD